MRETFQGAGYILVHNLSSLGGGATQVPPKSSFNREYKQLSKMVLQIYVSNNSEEEF